MSRFNDTLELRSEDGVIFKVQSFSLMASRFVRVVFKDMILSSLTSSTDVAQTPIDISAHSVVLQLFVRLIEQSSLPLLQEFFDSFPSSHGLYGRQNAIKALENLLVLCDQFECTVAVRERAFAYFQSEFSIDPWTVFVIASRYEDMDMGRKAIRSMDRSKGLLDPASLSVADAGRLRLNWLMGYWRAYEEVDIELIVGESKPTSHATRYQISLRVDSVFWAAVADVFKVPTE